MSGAALPAAGGALSDAPPAGPATAGVKNSARAKADAPNQVDLASFMFSLLGRMVPEARPFGSDGHLCGPATFELLNGQLAEVFPSLGKRIQISHSRREEQTMTDRSEIESLIKSLYAARVAGDIDTIGAIFAQDATFKVAGSPEASPMATTAKGHSAIMSLMQGMIDSFELSDFSILETLIDGDKAAVRWQATVHHVGTAQSFATELADFIEVSNNEIVSFIEFLDTAQGVEVLGAG
jgi:ketosteroid isomerase-like protein